MQPVSLLMHSSLFATHAWIEQLKCSSCNNYLSYFPIYSSNTGNICARCTPSSGEYIRNEIYEVVSQNIIFPCRYKSEGCCETLVPTNIPQHEEKCPYRTSECPTRELTACSVKVSQHNMIKHCHEEHSEYFLKKFEFDIETTKSQRYDYLLEHEKQLLILRSEFQPNEKLFIFILSCSVCYNLTFTCGNRSLSVKSNDIDEENVYKISLDALITPERKISAKIYLDEKVGSLTVGGGFHKELSNLWKCFSCSRYILQVNVYNNNAKCPICQNYFYPNNTSLHTRVDEIATFITFPCENAINGCSFIGKFSQITGHQEFCQFRSQRCPAKDFASCSWKGLGRTVQSHLLKRHRKLFINSSFITEDISKVLTLYASQFKRFYFLQYSHYLFKLIFLEKNERFYWVMQMIGEFKNEFSYVIAVYDQFKRIPQFTLTQPCSKESREDVINNLTNYNYLSLVQIKNLLRKQQTIAFKARILKNNIES